MKCHSTYCCHQQINKHNCQNSRKPRYFKLKTTFNALQMDINIKEYEEQLRTVNHALNTTENSEERTALEALKSDLLQLLELTQQTAAVEQAAKVDDDELSDELQKFRNEIDQVDGGATVQDSTESKEEDIDLKLQELKHQLEDMVGQKCSAPHQHSWGALSYHNAIICAVDDSVDMDNEGKLCARLRVLFTNPTHREMLPCSYYLQGECRFSDAQCHYSHGELVAADELRAYMEPDFTRLARNCVVLARLQDRLWHRGRVLCANFIEKLCRVRLDGKIHKEREIDLAFENLFPIFHDEELSSSSSDSGDDTDSEELDDLDAVRQAHLVERSLFEFQPSQPLGEWEKHTKGIGSKLMAKMGYVHGTGLGSDGRGIVTPISAQILPQGCSLDRCMELREAANGDKNLFSVEKKLRREKKRQEAVNSKVYERESQRVDVFSFLNENVFASQAANSTTTKGNKQATALHQHSTKSLNVESVRVADDIRRKEREIARVQESLRRNTSSASDVHKRLQQQLQTKTQELDALQRQEKILFKEQATRKTKDKLCVF